MKVTVIGLTELNIVFNHLNLVLRGQQTARSVKVANEDQKAELIQLQNTGMIEVIGLEEKKPKRKPRTRKATAKKPGPKATAKKPGPKKKTTKKSGPKAIKRSDVPPEESEEKSEVTVMTPGGPAKGKMVNKAAEGKENESKVQASLDAMKEIEESEGKEVKPDLEKDLDASEKMGGTAVIATGSGDTKKVDMKNSVLPEADEIRKRDPFIDNDLSKIGAEDAESFVDKSDVAPDSDDGDEHFIEV